MLKVFDKGHHINNQIQENLFRELKKYLESSIGLNFSDKRDKELINRMNQAAEKFNFTNTSNFILWLLNNNLNEKQTEILAGFLTIGETYFLRENKAFEYLEDKFLPNLIYNRRGKEQRLRVWSAGCASGEEAYSLAITLLRAIPDIEDWDITIQATDINPDLLKNAKKGIYTDWSFRKTPQWFINNYFKKTDNKKYSLLARIKKMVSFSYHNLAKDNYPSLTNNTNAMDIIFCRNVLIYFSPEVIGKVTRRLYNSLSENGILIVSPVDTSNMFCDDFNRLMYSGITIYKKGDLETKKITVRKRKTPVSFKPIKIIKKPVKPDVSAPSAKIQKPQAEKKIQKPLFSYEEEFNKAVGLFEKGLYGKVEELLVKIIKYNTKKYLESISLLAKTKANLGKLNEAHNLCLEALKLDKMDASLHYLLATIMMEQGNGKDAVSSLNRTLYLNPDFPLAHFILGNYYTKSGKNDSGRKHYKNTLSILKKFKPEEILPESDGITAGRLREIINATNA